MRGELRRGLAGLVVGVCADLMLVPLAADVRDVLEATVRTLEEAGARLVEVELPEAELILPAFGTIQSAEALETHRAAGLYPARRGEYGADVLGRLEAAERGDGRAVPRARPPTASACAPRSRACSARATCC